MAKYRLFDQHAVYMVWYPFMLYPSVRVCVCSGIHLLPLIYPNPNLNQIYEAQVSPNKSETKIYQLYNQNRSFLATVIICVITAYMVFV